MVRLPLACLLFIRLPFVHLLFVRSPFILLPRSCTPFFAHRSFMFVPRSFVFVRLHLPCLFATRSCVQGGEISPNSKTDLDSPNQKPEWRHSMGIPMMPRKCLSCFTPLGRWIASIACTLLLWGLIPFLLRTYPRYSISSAQNVDLSALTFKPASRSRLCHRPWYWREIYPDYGASR